MAPKSETTLRDVFRNVFDDEDLEISREMTADDIEGWDSVTHVTLVINIEKAFGIKFKSSEVAGLKNIGDLEDLIQSRGGDR
ncbi:acyl carrier protein [Singulisphaera sp. PoT]|uniref:acyl carrier protein n=1 Tax=Singulisphaera sp. PoT TaxID=3411797 RepID=UPI003BF50340